MAVMEVMARMAVDMEEKAVRPMAVVEDTDPRVPEAMVTTMAE